MSVFRLLEHLQLGSRLNQDSPEMWSLCMMVRKVAMGCLDTIILPRPRWVQLTAFLVVLRVSECVICLPLALLSFILFRFIWVFYYLSVQVYLVSCKKKTVVLWIFYILFHLKWSTVRTLNSAFMIITYGALLISLLCIANGLPSVVAFEV